MMLRWLVAFPIIVLGLAAAAADRTVSVFVELDGPSTAELALQSGPGPKLAAVRETVTRRHREIQARHTDLEPRLAALGARVTGRFASVANAVRILVPESRLAEVSALPGVRRVQRAHHYQRHLSSSVPWIGAPSLWTPAGGGLTGKGVRIAVIDSGIDYLHADFGGAGRATDFTANDSTVIEPGSFPTAKVVGGTDFVGDDYNADDPQNNSPVPDPDPLDTAENGHGSHVAGIAAGVGVLTNGTAYSGPYTTNLNLAIGPGVAPEASLYALKVFGRDGSTDAVVDALEWAIDPNGDGDTSDHLDVAVLSLGDYFGFDDSTDIELQSVDRLSALGCAVAISAGNAGNTSYILSSPGVAVRPITVANSIDNGTSDIAIEITAPAAVAGKYISETAKFGPVLADITPIRGRVVAVDPHDACDPLTNAADLPGNIALIDRGTCFFADKTRKAQAAGAIAVIVVNNVDTPAVVGMTGTGDLSDITIPVVMISKADGARLRPLLGEGVQATLDGSTRLLHPELADHLESETSRGPVFRSNRLKPDIAAPGTSIASAKSGSGHEDVVYSGTSMSAPHVAGAAALLKQAHPTWTDEDIKAALMNTAVATHDADGHPYPESLAGAGRLHVDAAARTAVIAMADGGTGEVSLSFGARELIAPLATNRTLRIVNHGNSPVTLHLAASNTVADAGITLTATPSTITVPARGAATVDIRLDADPSQFQGAIDLTSPARLEDVPRRQLPESSGEIWLRSENNSVAIHVPWYVILRAGADFHATTTSIGAPVDEATPVSIPTRGATAHRAPLVSAFQWGATDENRRYTDHRAVTDILSIGAASDYLTFGSISNTTIYFGMSMAGHWLTPQRAWYYYDIEIDTNGNGRPDFTIANSDSGAFATGDIDGYDVSNDALQTVLRSEATFDLIGEWPLNFLEPDVRDTAPFLNGVIIHAVQAADLGLTDNRTSFRYRAVTDSEFSDETSWITFDAAKPIVDPSPFGLQGSPFFDEGRNVQVKIHRVNAGTASVARVLLLHQHNAAGAQSEVISFDLNNPDSDNDGLPDAWELQYFGDLSFGSMDDPDRDGLENLKELAQGSNPLEIRLLLPSTGATETLRWISPAGRTFTIERASSVDGPFTPLRRQWPAVEGINKFTDPDLSPAHQAFFYRLRQE